MPNSADLAAVPPFPDRAFHDPAQFGFISELEKHAVSIEAEYRSIETALIDYVETHLFDFGWKVFGLWNLPHREPLLDPRGRCPFTRSLIERLVPNHGAVAFSVLAPGTRIKPHVGYAGHYLRCHLALDVPPGDCAIKVAGETRCWQPGKAIVFDDRLTHEAWNLTASPRVVLLFDFDPTRP